MKLHFKKLNEPAKTWKFLNSKLSENSKLIIEAGANILVSGTTIFKNNNGDIKKNIETLRLI